MTKIITSSFKVFVGFLILGACVVMLVNSLEQFQIVMEVTYDLKGIIPNHHLLATIINQTLKPIES
ncbi:PTS transporter subunit IIC [[Mycoplasma] cavipharyngis]|uniref:PTS transporter subunit IIC n=1 Tax=[Mycoplasma] cavipharyngis TaxID=92757 RepID=UPI003703DFC5